MFKITSVLLACAPHTVMKLNYYVRACHYPICTLHMRNTYIIGAHIHTLKLGLKFSNTNGISL